jgi:hypothetical protein
MKEFPELDGIHWVSNDNPDIVMVKTRAIETNLIDIGIDTENEFEIDFYLDLSKISAVREYFVNVNQASDKECVVDFGGDSTYVIDVNIIELLRAWEFCKKWNNANKNI